MVREELLKIVYWHPETAKLGMPKPLARDRIEAAKNLVMMDLALLRAEIANGMYKKPLDAIVKQYRYDPLPDEVRAKIIAAWTRGGLLPPAAIKAMVPGMEPEATECLRSDGLPNRAAFATSESTTCPNLRAIRNAIWSGFFPSVTWSRRKGHPGSACSSQAWAWSFLASAVPG